jgi:hypothetical protein
MPALDHQPAMVCQRRSLRAARRIAGALAIFGLATAFAGASPARTPGALLRRTFGGERAERGYLAAAGVPPLRWLERPAPAPLPERPLVTLYRTAPPTTTAAGPTVSPTQTDPAGAGKTAEKQTPPVKAEDFLPFFEHKSDEPPVPAARPDAQRFVPANATLPPSSAEYHLK